MRLTKEQISELACKHVEEENGLHDLFEVMIEAIMNAERVEFLRSAEQSGNKGNGFRPGHSYGHGRVLTFRIPRDRYGNFHPALLAVLRNQEEECERLAGTLYCKGLTQEQVSEVFEDIYGEHYSKASISRMLDYLRTDVSKWLVRSLEAYYPIVFIDCVFMKVHRERRVDTEAFYVVLAVREDKRREVLGIYNEPNESALGWGRILGDLRDRGVEHIGLICADGLRGLDNVIAKTYSKTKFQRCTTHLKRNILSEVRNCDKAAVAEDLRQIFRTGDRSYTQERAWVEWQAFCGRWGKKYKSIKRRCNDLFYMAYFTYLEHDYRIQSMIYTTNWIERLQRDFRRVTRMRGAMPSEEAVLLLMGKTAMDKTSYMRQVPRIGLDKTLFPDEPFQRRLPLQGQPSLEAVAITT